MIKRLILSAICFTALCSMALFLPGCGGGDSQQQGSFEVDGSEPGRQQLRPMRPREAPAEDAPEAVEAPIAEESTEE